MASATEPRHPIGVVSERTGLTPDVLRVWERRHNVVDPVRSPGGQRIYSDADIERLSLLHRATRGGHGISHVAGLGKQELEDLVAGIEQQVQVPQPRTITNAQPEISVERAMILTEAIDPSGLETLLRRSVARYGIVGFIDTIGSPFLRRVGDAWHAGELSVAQEHLATAVVQRVVSETSPLLTNSGGNPTIVIATLEGERHAIGALMAAATAASEGWRVIFLGADLPASEISETAVRTNARAVGISVVVTDRKAGAIAELKTLERALPAEVALVVGGAGSRIMSPNRPNTSIVETMAELGRVLASILGRTGSEYLPESPP